jgi:hypothetical protein
MGMSQPQLSATNYVLDYQCNLLNPYRNQLFQRLGPNAGAFPQQGKGQLLNDMQQCISGANPALVAEYRKLQYYLYGCIGGVFLAFILMFVFVTSAIIEVGLAIFFVAIGLAIVGICIVSRKIQVVGEQWRGQVMAALQPKLQQWKSQYPAFTFTLIYPVEVWRRGRKGRRRRVAIWVYMRITQGLCQTGYNEPIFASSGQAPTQVQQTTTVVIQQQPQTQGQMVMVQGPDGKMVQAQQQMINGQQVLVVQQPPPPGQQQYQQPQQPQYAPQQQQYQQPQQQPQQYQQPQQQPQQYAQQPTQQPYAQPQQQPQPPSYGEAM